MRLQKVQKEAYSICMGKQFLTPISIKHKIKKGCQNGYVSPKH